MYRYTIVVTLFVSNFIVACLFPEINIEKVLDIYVCICIRQRVNRVYIGLGIGSGLFIYIFMAGPGIVLSSDGVFLPWSFQFIMEPKMRGSLFVLLRGQSDCE